MASQWFLVSLGNCWCGVPRVLPALLSRILLAPPQRLGQWKEVLAEERKRGKYTGLDRNYSLVSVAVETMSVSQSCCFFFRD